MNADDRNILGRTGERAAWFRDSEGNLLGIGEPVV
jgi:hypothetical protein